MNKREKTRLTREMFVGYFGEEPKELLVKIIALNVFSFFIFFFIENTFFRFFYDMTFLDSLNARVLAIFINTPVALFWHPIEKQCKKIFIRSRYFWIRDKWEEASLFIVKTIVNFTIYIIVGLNKGHFSFDSKLLSKVGIIVLISYFLADFLKYKVVPFFRSLIIKDKEVIFSFKLNLRTKRPVIVPFRRFFVGRIRVSQEKEPQH